MSLCSLTRRFLAFFDLIITCWVMMFILASCQIYFECLLTKSSRYDMKFPMMSLVNKIFISIRFSCRQTQNTRAHSPAPGRIQASSKASSENFIAEGIWREKGFQPFFNPHIQIELRNLKLILTARLRDKIKKKQNKHVCLISMTLKQTEKCGDKQWPANNQCQYFHVANIEFMENIIY